MVRNLQEEQTHLGDFMKILFVIQSILLILNFFFLTACGLKPQASSKKPQNSQVSPIKESEILEPSEFKSDQGFFRVTLLPLNESLNLKSMGEFHFHLDSEKFSVRGYMKNIEPAIKHFQMIHEGEKCPTMKSDLNQDGVIVFEELINVVGKKIIPLDGNLSSQLQGIDYGPVGDDFGEYVYKKTVQKEAMLEDLYAEDDAYFDELKKLELQEKIRLNRRVLVIYGISPQMSLPDSIDTLDHNIHEYMPIACGEIEMIN